MTLTCGADILIFREELNVASSQSRRRFAREAGRAAKLESPHLEIDQDEVIAALTEHAARAAAEPPAARVDAPARPKIANHEGGVALGLSGIDAQLAAIAPGWPKLAGDRLFVADRRGGPEHLDSHPSLFSWSDGLALVDRAAGPTMIAEGRYLFHLRRHAERYQGIDVMPRQPPIPGIYRMTPGLPGAAESAGAPDELVASFRPETPVDRELGRRLDLITRQKAIEDLYTTAEVAEVTGKAEFTVREHCRLGRIKARKRARGRGKHPAWIVAHTELPRFQKEGLLPVRDGA